MKTYSGLGGIALGLAAVAGFGYASNWPIWISLPIVIGAFLVNALVMNAAEERYL
jgi:hypothetical protein